MKLETTEEFAAIMAKKNCKICWGRGSCEVSVGVGGPIVNPIIVEGQLLRPGTPGVQETILCLCVRKKIERLEKANGQDLQT